MEALEHNLTQHPFLAGLEPHHFSFIAECACEAQFEADQYLLYEGQAADEFHLIRRGRVVLRTSVPGHHFTTIQILEAGDIVGWSWLMPPYQCQFSAQATQPTQVITVSGKCLREQCEKDHDLGYELQKRLAALVGEILKLTKMRLG